MPATMIFVFFWFLFQYGFRGLLRSNDNVIPRQRGPHYTKHDMIPVATQYWLFSQNGLSRFKDAMQNNVSPIQNDSMLGCSSPKMRESISIPADRVMEHTPTTRVHSSTLDLATLCVHQALTAHSHVFECFVYHAIWY